VRFDLLDETLYLELLVRAAGFADRIRHLPPRSWICVDEVQRLPSLLNEVHRSIEEKGLRFVLSGSSARKLRHGGVNLLAGRALLRSMHPFLPPELEGRFSLEAALRVGTLPVVLASTRPEETLRAYIHSYLKEEIQTEALVRSLAGFARFLPIAALLHGQMVNVSSLARDAGVARTTVNDYLEILEDTLLAFRVPGFEACLRVRERKHPKLYWVDAGLVRAARDQLGPAEEDLYVVSGVGKREGMREHERGADRLRRAATLTHRDINDEEVPCADVSSSPPCARPPPAAARRNPATAAATPAGRGRAASVCPRRVAAPRTAAPRTSSLRACSTAATTRRSRRRSAPSSSTCTR
jgi:hypothetical protein